MLRLDMVFVAVFSLFLTIHVSTGFFMNSGPCYLYPNFPMSGIPPKDATTNLDMPSDCRNGTFYWDYPSGHVFVHFTNEKQREVKICFRDDLGGDEFTIVDLTGTNEYRLTHIERDSKTKSCTHVNNAREILLRIDAPDTQYYMGAMLYTVEYQ